MPFFFFCPGGRQGNAAKRTLVIGQNVMLSGTCYCINVFGSNDHTGIAVHGHANVTVGSTAIVKGESGIEIRDGRLSVATNASITGTEYNYSYTPSQAEEVLKAATTTATEGWEQSQPSVFNGGLVQILLAI